MIYFKLVLNISFKSVSAVMSQEVSSYALYLVLNKILSCEPGIFEIINTIVFYSLFDSTNPLKYKEEVDFLLIQNISVRDMAYFLIEIKKDLDYYILNKNLPYYNFSIIDNELNEYIDYRRRCEWDKIDYLLDTQQSLSNTSFNILLYLYKPLLISFNIGINYQIHKENFKFIFTNLNMTRNEVSIRMPCTRCGCSKRFDDYGDRICFCDTCKLDCYNHLKIVPKRKIKKKNYELCKMSLMIKKFGKKITDTISQHLMLSFHEIPKNLYLILRDKNIDITDICNFILEWKNFKKSVYILNYENFLEQYPVIDEVKTIMNIISLEKININKFYREFGNNINSMIDLVDVYYYNFLSIKSINIMALLLCSFLNRNLCYNLYNNILTKNNITIKDIYLIDKQRIYKDYRSIIDNNEFVCYNHCSCINCNYTFKLEFLIKLTTFFKN